MGTNTHSLSLAIWTPRMGICTDPPLTVASHSCVRSLEPTEDGEGGGAGHELHRLRPLRDQGTQPADSEGRRLAAPREEVAGGSRIERSAVRCPRQERRDAATARRTSQGSDGCY